MRSHEGRLNKPAIIHVSKHPTTGGSSQTYKLAYPPSHQPMIRYLCFVSVDPTSALKAQCALTLVSQEGPEGHLLLLLLLFGRYIINRQRSFPSSRIDLPSPSTRTSQYGARAGSGLRMIAVFSQHCA
jgi:hypothetical protein